MTPNYLEYPLNNGFVDNWLILGPLTTPVEVNVTAESSLPNIKDEIAKKYHEPVLNIGEDVIEHGAAFVPGSEGSWKYYRCREDHLVDISADYANWNYVYVVAYCEVRTAGPGRMIARLDTINPVDVWLNDQIVFHSELFSDNKLTFDFPVDLQAENKLVVRLRQLGNVSCVNSMRFQFVNPDESRVEEIQVCLPTKARYPLRFQELESNLDKAHLDQVVNYKGSGFKVNWSEGTGDDFHYHYQVQDDQERIYVEGTWQPETGGTDIGHPMRLFERPFRIVLKAPPREYFEMNNRYQRVMPLVVLDTKYAFEPTGSYAIRRAEALKDAAKHEGNLFGQIARIVTGKLGEVQEQVFQTAAAAVQRRDVGSGVILLGMLGTALRNTGQNELESILKIIQEAALDFANQSGSGLIKADSESSQIILAANKVLAGQFLDNENLRQEGERESTDWIKTRGKDGFQEWHSNSRLELVIVALAHLTSLSVETTLQELAAVLLDKVLFELAVHSYKGALASAHSITEAGMLKSAQLEATSGVMRMLNGMGVFNPHIAGVVSLAVADYEFPTFFAEIANDQRDEMLSRENHAGTSIVTYRTPDFMLSSAQDWRSGEQGSSELVWQAALGPDALVFTSHPECISESPARRPGHWLGNAVLPRVAQWKDTLVAMYDYGEKGMNFTHAYFPVHQFDEYVIKDGWAFARKGDGYLALTAARGLEFIKEGPGGYHELRSYGTPNIWICQMGRSALDGAFAEFQTKILTTRLEWPGNSVKFVGLRGEQIEFGWEAPLVVNGMEQSLKFDRAIENPYCTAELHSDRYEIGFGDVAMRLNFE